MPRVNKNEDESMEGSPLLMNMNSNLRRGTEQPAMATSRKSRFHSTISPEKFDMTRFTTRVEEEENESSFRIILYVIAVIVVGVGLALFVKFFITKGEDTNNTPTDQNNTEETPTDTVEDVVDISIAPKADATAIVSSVPYGESEQVTLGLATVSGAGTIVDKLNYTRYNTFSQMVLGFEGLTTSDLPSITAAFDKATDILTIKLPTETNLAEELKTEVSINDIITSVKYDLASNSLSVKFREDSSYKIFVNNGQLVVEVKTAAQIAKEANPEVEVPTPTPTPVTPPAATGTLNLDNSFSRNKQSLVTSVSSNTIGFDEIYYTDFGDSFEFGFGMKNSVGENFIPNATAELVVEGGVNYLDLTIQNLTGIQFTSDNVVDQSDAPISLAGANFIRADLKSFDATSGIAKIRIQLRNAADFRLMTEKTVSGLTQVTAVIIKD